MKISPSQLSLNKKSNLSGLAGSALFHAILIVAFINLPTQIKPSMEESIKISLKSFKPPAAPLPPAPQPAPVQSLPEPIVVPPPPEPVIIPEPVVVPQPVVVPEPVKKVEPKPVEKPKPKPKPKKVAEKVEKPVEPIPAEPVVTAAVEPATPKEVAQPSTPVSAPVTTATDQKASPVTTQTVGEFSFATSAGDERFAKMQSAIKKHQKYPKRATKMRHQGVVEVSFFFKTNGTVSDVKVIKSSGFDSLDEAAMEAIRKASKEFPILEKDYLIKIPMAYKLI
ncbi:energy transducer TonB [Campylobacter sp. CCUG 57310]|uniref:energy transducer TonB n=1 Tax=Campylobacter sp. CCUG 57310 TaxID=2517362 RepID=UPI0015664FFD|nr:energy transducer TonB [Campylobacter sp. CCUG 57310]QKF91657.1 energy transduction protein TonB [Campylobacter sp. CCUG 57310]